MTNRNCLRGVVMLRYSESQQELDVLVCLFASDDEHWLDGEAMVVEESEDVPALAT